MKLTLFHTAGSNVALFDVILNGLAPDVPRRHVVDEAILREALAAGRVTDDMRARVDYAMAEVLREADFVLCTCSTIGALAEHGRTNVLRVDRPMAERAVASGQRIAIAATLASTIAPTQDLLEEVALKAGRAIELVDWHLADAWAFKQQGDEEGYAREIARDVTARAATDAVEVVVLAQASMALAEPLCSGLDVPVLSSPRLGVEEALRRLREISHV